MGRRDQAVRRTHRLSAVRRRIAAIVAHALIAAYAADTAAQNYPARPLRIIVPQSAGGSTDLVARPLARKLADALGQSVVVDNRPGAGSVIGTDLVAKAAPDGYTLLAVAASGANGANPLQNPFDPIPRLPRVN